MNRQQEFRIEFKGRRKEQETAHAIFRTQVVNADSRGEAEDKLKDKFLIQEIYD